MQKFKIIITIAILTAVWSCNSDKEKQSVDFKSADWKTISTASKGKTVHFMMWQGSPVINEYMNNYVIPKVKEKFNIDLKISGGQGPEIIQLAMGEKQAGIKDGQIDLVWINGETFFQLRQIDALWGPFVTQLPNSKLIDFEDPYISKDFQQPINGMEAPWGMGQFAMYSDAAKIKNPPSTIPELESYLKEFPGTFTISNDFTGMTLLKSFLAEFGGSPKSLNGPFDEEKYKTYSRLLWNWIHTHKKFFWKEGTTFPKEQTIASQLFANGELLLGYGFGEGGIEERVSSSLYPKSTKVYPWKNGTIKNANYLGILHNAQQKAAAMQVINFLISPEAQFKKADANGMDSNTILDISKLSEEWKKKFIDAPKRKYGIELTALTSYAIPEPAAEYMLRLYEDFRTEIIEN